LNIKNPENIVLISVIAFSALAFFVGHHPEDPMILTENILLPFELSIIAFSVYIVVLSALTYYTYSLYRYITGSYKRFVYYFFLTLLLGLV